MKIAIKNSNSEVIDFVENWIYEKIAVFLFFSIKK